RVLNEKHPNLQPLLLAVAQKLRGVVKPVRQLDDAGDLLDALDDLRRAIESPGAERRPALGVRHLQVLEYGQRLADRRRLEFAAHPAPDDLVLPQLRQLVALKEDRARVGARPA